MCVRACVRACVRLRVCLFVCLCVRAYVRASVRACECVCMCLDVFCILFLKPINYNSCFPLRGICSKHFYFVVFINLKVFL